jgi:ribosomal-protein-alanine N-acetyltransferase
MNAHFRIRPAASADIERIVALDRATELLPHWPVAAYVAALEPATGSFAPPGTHRCLFVAETARELAGFAVASVTRIQTPDATQLLAELESVAVAIASRRSGIGRALCLAVIDWAHQHGATAIELEVRSRSEGAIALYRQLGFAALGRRASYYRDPLDDAILMRLDPEPEQSATPPRKP